MATHRETCTCTDLPQRRRFPGAFVDAVARRNVELTIGGIRRNSPGLAGIESSGAPRIAGSMCDLKTWVIEFFHA